MYKKITICIFLIFCVLASYSQTEERAPNGPRGVKNKRDELRRRQEVWKTYSAFGDLINETEYKNDKKEGKCTIYYPVEGDKVCEEIQYFDGKKDGTYVKKYISGQVAIEGENNLGLRVGLWTSYYEDGQIKTEGNYILGKKDGEWKTYNRKGVLTKTINYSIVITPIITKKVKDDKKPKARPSIK